METTEKKIIMYDSPKAATYQTNVEGWVSSDGRFWGKGEHNEHMARYTGSTHRKCECGAIIETRSYLSCESCRKKKQLENYNKLTYKAYDGSPVVTAFDDQYFFNEDDLNAYLLENNLDSISLLFCEENNWFKIEGDYWADIMPENSDGELPDNLQKALDELNKVISELPPCSYTSGKIRTFYSVKK
ncbi:hypothetical protein AB670_00056 [Chryseobacterium sp. MOF25P]|uniref:hypothetical protein n=1 Tax=unclassified Chryseobacterium TaxID=2593645 RepID=UPI000805F61B|nr:MULTISPECIES: hypothetical protein [unclassified Chryseobacterium]OBW43526.1 hypothetical protein AB670_00056 [Chryseobacterium sp. MOF25P]OBW46700.1 hypothetical protein AB671_01195 [Chryseobacterium sp. BGARF1]